MESPEKQDITTGRPPEETPILANAGEGTVESSKPVPAKSEGASIEIASILALLQTDFSDLQSKGLRIAILARESRLYASIEWTGHTLEVRDTGGKVILLDGRPVTEYE